MGVIAPLIYFLLNVQLVKNLFHVANAMDISMSNAPVDLSASVANRIVAKLQPVHMDLQDIGNNIDYNRPFSR